ncbi:MAG: hypothetical protein IE878_06630, partial [Epsilonproteobacteria bacterium]|nr:hypothetical protein [Campylobacterota bacterium]
MQVIRSSIIIATLITNLLSQDFECKVDDRILYGIACIEKHKKRPVGYPYIISLNNEKDQKKAKTFVEIKDLFLDSRTLDCDNQERCVKVFNFLLSKGIKNLDNGGFQLNNLYWEVEQVADYFDPYKSYLKACEIVQ